MLQTPIDVQKCFPVRKTKRQKRIFCDAVCVYAKKLGYSVFLEKGSFGCKNVVIGDSENAKYLITAHYDTCARNLFPNFLTPCNPTIFYLSRIILWGIVILFGSIIGALSGIVFGPEWIPLSSCLMIFAVFGLMIFGPANNSNTNDNTSGIITLLEILCTMPENLRSNVCFVLFDLEEAGMIGSVSYYKKHKSAADKQLVLNLDCVGDGDHILMIPTKQLKKDKKTLTSLYKACGYFGKKSVLVKEKGFSVYPSDQSSFPYGVGICALRKGKCGLFLSRIHTPKDTVLDPTNVNILRAALISYISCNAVN